MEKRIPIADATPAQLRSFAANVLNIDVTGSMNRAALLAAIRQVYAQDTIELPGYSDQAAAAAGLAQRVVPTDNERGPDEWVEIVIAETDEPGGKDAVPVGVNGAVMWIERGKPSVIRRPYLQVLLHAKRTVFDQSGAITGGFSAPREVPAYPLSILRDPAPPPGDRAQRAA